jgi:hypothetical protein
LVLRLLLAAVLVAGITQGVVAARVVLFLVILR